MQSDEVVNCKEKGSEATIVSNDDLKQLPYQSVGSIYIESGDCDYYRTGYVANLS